MTEERLAAVVEKTRAQATIGSLRAEGIYDDKRTVYECGSDAVAIPVRETPRETPVREVVVDDGPRDPQSLSDVLASRGWTDEELETVPSSWAVVGTVILVRLADCPRPAEVGEALLDMHGGADTVLAREGINGAHREPDVTVIAGEGDTQTVHREHGTEYAVDLAELMFSPGNKAERTAMGERVDDEDVLDMFAGIGYFTLPMARNGAAVTAIERNPTSFQYLVENVMRNDVQDAVETYRADCRDVITGFDGRTFDRVVMGHYDAYEYLDSALTALAPGGTLHMHAATPEQLVPERPLDRLERAATNADRTVKQADVRTVKGYSEGVLHVVVDAVIQ